MSGTPIFNEGSPTNKHDEATCDCGLNWAGVTAIVDSEFHALTNPGHQTQVTVRVACHAGCCDE